MGIATVIVKRFLEAIPTTLLIIATSFLLINLAPGDPALLLLGQEATPQAVAALREQLGLNLPLPERFVLYLEQVLRGNLGTSIFYHEPVVKIILERLPNTLLLMGTAYLISISIGVLVGIISASKRNSATDYGITIFSTVFYSQPEFLVAIFFLLAFGFDLRLFPMSGIAGVGLTGYRYYESLLWHLALPASVLALTRLAIFSRFTRAAMLEALGNDYITTARAYGFPQRTISFHFAFRNAVLSIMTLITVELRFMITGAVLVETVFAWPGIGSLLFQSILNRDYPLILGLFIIASLFIVALNFIADVLAVLVDPRVKSFGKS